MKHYMNIYKDMWKNALNTEGVINRKTFLEVSFVQLVIYALILMIGWIESLMRLTDLRIISTTLFVLYFIVSFLPYASLMMRRLNDAKFSRFYFYFIFIPIVGWIILGFALLTKSLVKDDLKKASNE